MDKGDGRSISADIGEGQRSINTDMEKGQGCIGKDMIEEADIYQQ